MIRQRSPIARGRRTGNVVILVAVCLTVLLVVVAITLDGGLLLADRRHAQAAVDAAAMAGATDLYENFWTNSGEDPDGTAYASAMATAAANDLSGDHQTSNVTVHIPPANGRYAGLRGYIEVEVETFRPRSFSALLGSDPIPVRARAVAIGSAVAADVGILVLDPDDKGALVASGGGRTVVDDTPVVVNSKHEEAARADGGSGIKAPQFFISGDYDTQGGGYFDGKMYTHRPPMPDPLADLPAPNKGDLVTQSTKRIQETSGTIELQPGVYKNGINVSGTATLHLAPGVYYMDGGGFSFSGQGSLEGTGVMIYNAPGNGQGGGISVTGQGTINLTAPPDGQYQGVVFFQDRTANVTGTVEGTGDQTNITGTFYFAGGLLKVSGNGGVSNLGSQYISRLLQLGGNGGINIQWKPDEVARGRLITLVE